MRGLIFNLGFKYDVVYYQRKERELGKSKYTFFKMFDLAMSGIILYSSKLGLISKYISKINLKSKQQSNFIISDKVNYD